MAHASTATRILRLPEVIERTRRSSSAIYRDIAAGTFPKPVKLGKNARAVGWPESVVEGWIQEQISGGDK